MFIKQVSVFLENKQGRLAEVTGILAKDKINIKALSMAESRDFGILRLIVNDWSKCVEVLKKHQFITRTTDVVGVEIDDNPGGLCLVMDTIEQQGSIARRKGNIGENEPVKLERFTVTRHV